ncbi:hypothetical protein VCH24_39250 [Variovorax boronicumulans]|nr:hypothetical protein VCH24_39250 [Variovorax boronicumulans]
MSVATQPRLVKLTGIISNYKVTRAEACFVFTDSDRNAMGAVAIAAAVVGLSGPAVATASNATSTTENADYVEFELSETVVKGWVWRSPFKQGDEVEVIAEWRDDHYEAAGIARPSDRIIALYPHCSRGRAKHAKNAIKWWLICSTLFGIFILLLAYPVVGFRDYLRALGEGIGYGIAISYFVVGALAFDLARKWMPFVRLAERVFTTLGWLDPGSIDLIKSTKIQSKDNDSGELGTFYFRY